MDSHISFDALQAVVAVALRGGTVWFFEFFIDLREETDSARIRTEDVPPRGLGRWPVDNDVSRLLRGTVDEYPAGLREDNNSRLLSLCGLSGSASGRLDGPGLARPHSQLECQ